MTEKQMTDEDLWEKYSSGMGVQMTEQKFMEAIKESRKGMFTEDNTTVVLAKAVISRHTIYANAQQSHDYCIHCDNANDREGESEISEHKKDCPVVLAYKYLTERKGRG